MRRKERPGAWVTDLRSYIEERSVPVTESGCWIWMGALCNSGYGQTSNLHVLGYRRVMAHRLAYETHRSSIPEGMDLDHKCRVRCCVNPWHMEAVTHRENLLRGAGPIGLNASKTHCKNGHPLSGDNLYLKSGRWRACRTCARRRVRRCA